MVYRLVNEVDERWFDIHATDEDGKPLGQVQIMGWMYQYYNTEPKDKVFADLKKNIKISKQNIPAATQLFTPDWIVRYMVENSLGRLWVEGHPGFDKSDWKYYLDEAPQEPQVEQQAQGHPCPARQNGAGTAQGHRPLHGQRPYPVLPV